MPFSVFVSKQYDILSSLLETYFPEGCKAIDYTYGSGSMWQKVRQSKHLSQLYQITACDASPNKKIAESQHIHKLDLLTDDYAQLGQHDLGIFDPPYLIGVSSFYTSLNSTRSEGAFSMQIQGKNSWAADDLGKYTSNRTVTDFNRRVEALKTRCLQSLRPDGLLFVKILDVRNDGELIPHHINITNILSPLFKLIDVAVYIRQGATTWKPKEGLQCLHGYWLVFKLTGQNRLEGI